MATEKLYWKFPYDQEFDAKLLEIRHDVKAIVLDRTLFFPEGGGQAADSGWLNNYIVLDVRKDKEDPETILHFVEDITPLTACRSVNGAIDWPKRYNTMRLHSASHVGFLAFREVFDAEAQASSGRVDNEKDRSDYLFSKEITPEILQRVQDRANEIIASAKDAEIFFEESDGMKVNPWTGASVNVPPGLRRKWKIDGYDSMDCGGTHVKNLKEIGPILMKKAKSPGKGRTRIEVFLQNP